MKRAVMAVAFIAALTAHTAAAAPPNDACVDATLVTDGFIELFDSTLAATAADDPIQSCTNDGPNQNSHSVWYRFLAPANGRLTIETLSTVFPADPRTIVSVYAGSCGTLTEVACHDTPTQLGSSVSTLVATGVAYWIEITNRVGSIGGLVHVAVHFAPDSPICSENGGRILEGSLAIVGLRQPTGEQRVKMHVRTLLPMPLPNVTTSGFQVLAEDLSVGYSPIVEWSAQTHPVPPGTPGTGCDPRDGWTTTKNGSSYRYRNHSNMLPPDCAPGSANGLTEIRLLRKSKDGRTVDVKVRATDTSLLGMHGGNVIPIRLAVTLEATIGPDNVDRCAVSRPPTLCLRNGGATAFNCKFQ